MPANLSPEYREAEAAYKRARDPKERLECLREMLRTMPKHKGTEHLQADIKTRIRQLTDELGTAKKGPARSGPALVIRPEGAAQIALIGPPNSGKSTLHARLTGSQAETGLYPYTTQFPQPGMLEYEDVHFQLVDLPPLSPERPLPWIVNALQPADAALLVIDLGQPECVEQVTAVRELLADKRVTLLERWDLGRDKDDDEDFEHYDPFAIRLPTLLIATKADQSTDQAQELEAFHELTGTRYPAICVSAETGEGLDRIGPWLFRALHVVRVYTKAPGRPPDKDRPFTVRSGDTVRDVAELVHRELAGSLKYARLWRDGECEGLQVSRDHRVSDRDVLELHT